MPFMGLPTEHRKIRDRRQRPYCGRLEQAVIAGQKAQIGFQAAIQVRNRLLSAYTDIMNMQV